MNHCLETRLSEPTQQYGYGLENQPCRDERSSEGWPCLRAGYYKDARGDDACTPCGAGKANTDTASIAESACGVCDVNTYSLAGAGTCAPCHANAVSDAAASACTCAPGYDGTTANGTCTACLAGNSLGPPCLESSPQHSTAWADTVAWVRSRGPAVTRCEELKGILAFLQTCCTGRQGVRLC